jgi:hypothetical protein
MIECPWKNCKGTINLSKEFANWPRRGRTSFLIHTIMCPKCSNPVGSMELCADPWFEPKAKKSTINDPKTGKQVRITKKNMKRHLKKWAR